MNHRFKVRFALFDTTDILTSELTSYYPAKEGNKMKLTYTPRDVPAKGGAPAVFDTKLPWLRHDGGREMAGYRGRTGDCGCRGLSLAVGAFTDTPVEGPLYRRVYNEIRELKQVYYETECRCGPYVIEEGECVRCRTGRSSWCRCGETVDRVCKYHRSSPATQRRMLSPRDGTPPQVTEWMLDRNIGEYHSLDGGSLDRRNSDIQEGVVLIRIRKHITCLIDGVIHDTWHPQFSRRGGGEYVTDKDGSRNWPLTTPLSRYPKIIKAWRMGSRDIS